MRTTRESYALQEPSPDVADRLGQAASARVNGTATGSQLQSYDEFDTSLVRLVGGPHVVALLLGRRLAQRGATYGTPEGFAHARLGAERLAWQNRGLGEYTLADVYHE